MKSVFITLPDEGTELVFIWQYLLPGEAVLKEVEYVESNVVCIVLPFFF